MTLRIERDLDGGTTTLRLMGQLRSDSLEELQEQMRGSQSQVVVDLGEVTLVDVDTVRFLASCESDGVMVLHCPLYLRDWIHRERK